MSRHTLKDAKEIILACAMILTTVSSLTSFIGYITQSPTIIISTTLIAIAVGIIILYKIVLPHIQQSAVELSYQAFHDGLTGLVNRKQLEQSLELSITSAYRTQQKFAIFFLDIDHFKVINDSLGHDAGDQILKIIGDRLSKSIRKTDIAARLGGDEFILVLHGADNPETAATFAEKIINSVTKPIKFQEHELITTTSIGISFYPENGNNFTTLIKSADLALYKAKQMGRNNYQFCTPAMNEEIQEKLQIKNALQTALDNQEFHLVYQPKIDVIKNTIIGFEALLRWESLTYGNVPPNRIIPLTEEMGIINQLGEWIAKKAIEQLCEWHAGALPNTSVALNVATRHFLNPNFATQLITLINQANIPSELIELEIPESLIMQNPEYSLKVIRKLKDHNVHITIDNFGTGYSSIQQLYNFHVDSIKIDRKFIADIPNNTNHLNLLDTLISLAKSLHVTIIAEGVETAEQYRHLKLLGCDIIQGFYICKPMPAKDIEQFSQKFSISSSTTQQTTNGQLNQ